MEGGRERKKKDEVDELLEAAQDEMMLKLSVDSHMSHVSPDYLSPDLHNRFLALRSRPPSVAPPNHQITRSNGDAEDQLLARFAALKASSSSSQSNPPMAAAASSFADADDGEEDEVEKVIQWAKDAARLDPSPPSDDDDADDQDDDRSSEDEDDDDEESDGDLPRKDGKRNRSRG